MYRVTQQLYLVMIENTKIGIIHLIWIPLGFNNYKNFIDSYLNVSAGHEHELIFLFNGVKDENELQPYFEYAEISKIKYKYFSLKNGQDIEAYFWVSEKLSGYTHFLFLNSFSIILYNDWLQYYVNAIELEGVGLVGATGSWQSHYSNVFHEYTIAYEFNKSFLYNFRKYKLMLKAFFYWRFLFPSFPSPHIRTNAFIVKRDVFLKLKKKKITSKFDAYLFENGRKGLSNQLRKKGYQILVVDKFGNTYEPDRWPESKTFWIEEQQNLLIKDNQTKVYCEANKYERKRLKQLAWSNN